MNFGPKTRNLFCNGSLDLYNFDSACHEMSKYLGIVVSEKRSFEVWPNFNKYTDWCKIRIPDKVVLHVKCSEKVSLMLSRGPNGGVFSFKNEHVKMHIKENTCMAKRFYWFSYIQTRSVSVGAERCWTR